MGQCYCIRNSDQQPNSKSDINVEDCLKGNNPKAKIPLDPKKNFTADVPERKKSQTGTYNSQTTDIIQFANN